MKDYKTRKKGSKVEVISELPVSFKMKEIRAGLSGSGKKNFYPRINAGGHTAEISGLLYYNEGEKLISASKDSTIRVWDISDPKSPDLMNTIRGEIKHSGYRIRTRERIMGSFGRILAIAHSPDWTYLAVGASSHVRLYNLRFRQCVMVFSFQKDLITDIAFSKCGKFLAIGSLEKGVYVYFLDQLKYNRSNRIYLTDTPSNIRRILGDSTRSVKSVSFSEDKLLTASMDGLIRLYDIKNKFRLIKAIDSFKNDTETVARFSNSGKYLLGGSRDRGCILFDKEGNSIKEFENSLEGVKVFNFSPDDKYIMVGNTGESSGSSLYLYSIPEGNLIQTITQHPGKITAVAVVKLNNSMILASAGGDYHDIFFWNRKGEQISKIRADGNNINFVGITKDNKIGFTMKDANQFSNNVSFFHYCFDLENFGIQPTSEEEVFSTKQEQRGEYSLFLTDQLLFSNDILSLNSMVKIQKDGYDFSGVLYGKMNGNTPTCYTFISDSLIAVGSKDGNLYIYDLKGSPVATLQGHEGDILTLAPRSDGKFLVSAAKDRTIKLWNIEKYVNESAKKGDFRRLSPINFSRAYSKIKNLGYSKKEIKNLKEYMANLISSDKYTYNSVANYLKLVSMYGYNKLSPVLTIFMLKQNEWLAWTPRGYVVFSSPDTMKLIGYHVNRGSFGEASFITFNRVYSKFFRPDLVSLAWKNNEKYENIIRRDREDFLWQALVMNPPPQLEFLSPSEGDKIDYKYVEVKVKVKDVGGGIGDIRLYHNGKLVASEDVFRIVKSGESVDRGKVKQNKEFLDQKGEIIKTYSVQLVPGENLISSQALNYTNTILSGMTFLNLKSSLPQRQPKLYALVTGTKDFKNNNINLRYTHYDARSIEELFSRSKKKYYAKVVTKLLLDPGKKDIEKAFQEMSEIITPTDTFVFYASSHGVMQNDIFYLITSDCDTDFLDERVAITSYELMAFSKKIPALKQVFILDTCHSASSEWTFNDLYQNRLTHFSMGSGLHILSSSSAYRLALEGYNYHGLFSYFLIEALKGIADLRGNRDGKISLFEVARYIRENVKKVTFGYQQPLISKYGKDIILVEKY